MSRWSGLALIGAVGMCLVFALTASARVGSATSTGALHATTTPPSFPLSTRNLAVRIVGGRIVASATVVNTGRARVRSTTGVLGLISGAERGAMGIDTFSVPSLRAGRSSQVRLTTRPMRGLLFRSETVKAVLCTDIGSQIRRFASSSHCTRAGALAIAAVGPRATSGPVPDTTVQTGPAGASNSSTAVFGFVSTVGVSTFACSLDGGPWLACTSPKRYAGLVDGRHSFAVRATSSSGRTDPSPARVTWTVDTVAPKVTLRRPVNGSTTSDKTPTFSGTGGTAATDSSTVTVKVFSGPGISGSPVQTQATTRSGGTWSVPAAQPLANGTYTAQAQQSDSAGNTGLSTPSTFTIAAASPPPPPPSKYTIGGTVSGLSGKVVLQDSGGDDLNVGSNGSFTFATPVVAGGAYQVTVASNPTGQACTVSGGSGNVASANVTSVTVTCAATTPPPPPPPSTYSIGGTVSGLIGTVVLEDNGGDDLGVTSNGPFTLPTQVAVGGAYAVTVATNPAGETCTVSSGTGTVNSADVTGVTVTCVPTQVQLGSDDFNRPDGDLGAGWTAMNQGGDQALSIASDQVTGSSSATDGDIRSAAGESYASDQWSQVQVPAGAIGAGVGGLGEWVGPTVRSQDAGQNTYLGIYFWNNGSPALELFVRKGGTFSEIGPSVPCGLLPAGTVLSLTASGSTISFAQNGVTQITVTDTTLTGGAPGIMSYDGAAADNWSGGDAPAVAPQPMEVTFDHTDANGVDDYNVTSSDDGGGPHVLRVLKPTNPASGVPHQFLYVLPVEPEQGTSYGDGLETLRALDAQNQYNLTIVEPSFGIDPWYADNPSNSNIQYETFMTQDLVPWVTKNLATTGQEQNWLIGFSKSGLGAQDLLLKHPGLFTAAASWDFPADISTYDQFGSSSADEYGTDANFQTNYRLTASFLDAHKAPFESENRIWIGGYNDFQPDVSDYDGLLTSEGIDHTTEAPQLMAHRWDSGWVPIALSALSQDGAALPVGP